MLADDSLKPHKMWRRRRSKERGGNPTCLLIITTEPFIRWPNKRQTEGMLASSWQEVVEAQDGQQTMKVCF